MKIEEPDPAFVKKIWTASIPHISNLLEDILAELKIMNANSNNKEE